MGHRVHRGNAREHGDSADAGSCCRLLGKTYAALWEGGQTLRQSASSAGGEQDKRVLHSEVGCCGVVRLMMRGLL